MKFVEKPTVFSTALLHPLRCIVLQVFSGSGSTRLWRGTENTRALSAEFLPSSLTDKQQEKKPFNPHFHHHPAEDTQTYMLAASRDDLLSAGCAASQVVLYPEVDTSPTLTCKCDQACNEVLWFRSLEADGRIQFLASMNTASRSNQGDARFKASIKDTKGLLRIERVTPKDTGVYSCMFKILKTNESVWTPGIHLLPGVPAPTPVPTTTAEPVCKCPGNPQTLPPKACVSVMMWPLVGILAALVTALLSTLYYFSLTREAADQNQKVPDPTSEEPEPGGVFRLK
ncbi:hypothetical protein N1851_022106 [Merluccius polli]|uniref:Ig-like domain-containing protein n=1 Tax=Merluccius polli TaxID=89951 RepID=A0AA47MIX0_MERPO|nr:hypothetical protein N1851_022106 [Merluccius polli]